MLSQSFLLHAGVFNLNIYGVVIEARVLENNQEMEASYIDELVGKLDTMHPIVGFDLKQTSSGVMLLVLYVSNYCLLVKLRTGIKSSDALLKFLRVTNVCFVANGPVEVDNRVSDIRRLYGHGMMETSVCVEVFAESILKRKFVCSSLEELASEAGVTFPPLESSETTANSVLDGEKIFYTEEEIKYAVDEAYKCYTICAELMKYV